MALLHADNFSYYGTTTSLLLNGVYANTYGVSLVADPDGISGGKVAEFTFGGNQQGWRWVLPTATATVGVANRVWLINIPDDTTKAPNIIQWRDGSNNLIASVRVNPTGGFDFYLGAVKTASSTGPVMTANGWYHIEAKLVADIASAGSVEVRVEGIAVLTASGFSTSTATISQVSGGDSAGGSGATNLYIKDLVIWDGTGSQNNDFFGSVLVYEMTPTADTTFGTGWTSTDANAWSVLDNNPPDDTHHYISADSTPPAASVFALSDLPTTITSIRGLITRVRAMKSDGGDGSIKVSLKSGATFDDGATRPITTAPTYWSDVSELDPNTASAWTPVTANAASLVLTRTT